MVYGFISSLDDETTKVFFRSKKIRVNNIYNAGSLGELTSVLQSGDVVYIVSCNRFASVCQVYTFARFCHDSAGYEQRKEYECFWDWFKDAVEEMINEDECDG